MSAINEAFKRVGRTPGALPQPSGADDPFPEELSELPQGPGEAAPASQAKGRPWGHLKLPRWALVAAAVAGLAVLYVRLAPQVETRSALAEPNVYREKIKDERAAMLAQSPELPAERVGSPADQAKAGGPEVKQAPAQGQTLKADDEAASGADEEVAAPDGEADGDVEEPSPPPARAAQAGPAPARPTLPARRLRAARAPGAGPTPQFAQQGVKPYGPLPAKQFSYASAPVITARPQGAADPPATAQQPKDITLELFRQAIAKEKEDKPEQAAALYALVLDKQPDSEAASLRLGNLLYREQHYDDAVEVFHKAIKAHETAALHNNLGAVYLAQGKMDEARQEFLAAADLDHKYAEPHYNLACYYAKTGQQQEGMAELEKAKAIDTKVVKWAATDGDLAPLRALPEYKRLAE